jgi:uncharacterized protein (DUF488 family)
MMGQIWTIGHSTREIDKFISALEANEIKLIADIRLLPGSKRYPQFNRESLAESLSERGIRYEHFPEFGGRRKPKPDSPNTAWRNEAFRGYADHMETEGFREGVNRLVDLATGRVRPVGGLATTAAPTALTCAEAHWWR